MAEVLQTVIDLKSLQNAILRINNSDNSVQGKIAFAQGGYMLGGFLSNTGESGYDAIKKLLQVTDGNYAVLDPGRTTIGDVNQTLWLNASRVITMLPNLPQSPEVLCDADPDKLMQATQKGGIANLSLNVKDEQSAAEAKPTVAKGRKFNLRQWRAMQVVLWAILALVGAYLLVTYGDQFFAKLHELLGTGAAPAPGPAPAPAPTPSP